MITGIKVYNRFYMNLVARNHAKTPFKVWNLVSIHSPTEDPLFLDPEISLFKDLPIDERLKTMQDQGCQYAISLAFDDILPKHQEGNKYTLFDDKMAKRTLEFLEKIHSDKDESVLVLHCHAGISRSGAIAYFASQKYKIDFHDPNIYPNRWVLELLCKNSGYTIDPFRYDSYNGDSIEFKF